MKPIYLLLLLHRLQSLLALAFSIDGCHNIFLNIIANDTSDVSQLRGLYNEPVQRPSQAFGFTYEKCLAECGPGYDKANFTTATEQMGIWFFPYFTLLAQIPLQADNLYGDIQVLIYTIGSPLTALYSMFLAECNWIWLKGQFESIAPQDPRALLALKDIMHVMGKLQQFPIRIGSPELLTRALVSKKRRKWWKALAGRLAARERPFDGPAVVQIGFAVLAYILSVIQALAHMGG